MSDTEQEGHMMSTISEPGPWNTVHNLLSKRILRRDVPVVYLGGPITGIPLEAANGWRIDMEKALQSYGFQCLSPLRRYIPVGPNEHLIKRLQQPVNGFSSGTPRAHFPKALETLEGDLHDIHRADYVLINFLDALYPSVGSLVELGYAAALGKRIITILEPDDPHDHVFVTGLSLVVTSTDAAITALVNDARTQQGDE